MIDARELRIGNWVETVSGYVQVTGVEFNRVNCGSGDHSDRAVNPIPLTPEVLERCGFYTPNSYHDSVKFKEGVMIDLHHGDFYLRDNSRIKITSLHQLQNLYFALTSRELDYKP